MGTHPQIRILHVGSGSENVDSQQGPSDTHVARQGPDLEKYHCAGEQHIPRQ